LTILDRIVHNAYRLALEGPSMRDPKTAKAEATAPADETTNATLPKPAKGARK
jgi:hypothetical protein